MDFHLAKETLAGLKSKSSESPAENPSVWITELKSRKSRKFKKSKSLFFLMVLASDRASYTWPHHPRQVAWYPEGPALQGTSHSSSHLCVPALERFPVHSPPQLLLFCLGMCTNDLSAPSTYTDSTVHSTAFSLLVRLSVYHPYRQWSFIASPVSQEDFNNYF